MSGKIKTLIAISGILLITAISACGWQKADALTNLTVMRQAPGFNQHAEMIEYKATPFKTSWKYQCSYGKPLTLVFQGATLEVTINEAGQGQYTLLAKELNGQ